MQRPTMVCILSLCLWGTAVPGGMAGTRNNIGEGAGVRVQLFTPVNGYLANFGSDGTGIGQMVNPCGVTVDPLTNNIFLADNGNNRIEIWNATGQWLGFFSNAGESQISRPCQLAFAPNGNLYVTDSGNNRIDIFTAANSTRTAWNCSGIFGMGGTGAGQMYHPVGIAILPGSGPSNFTVYVADSSNNRIEVFNASGGYEANFGRYGTGPVQFDDPTSLAFTANGNLLVVDSFNNRVQILSSGGTFINQFGNYGTVTLSNPFGIAVCPTTAGTAYAGHIVVTDTGNSRVVVYSSTGAYLGTYGSYGTGSGQFIEPEAIAFFPNGEQVVTDAGFFIT